MNVNQNEDRLPSLTDLSGWGDRAAEFRDFLAAVDAAVMRTAFLSAFDLPDFDFASAFEDEADPEDVAREMLEDEGFPFED